MIQASLLYFLFVPCAVILISYAALVVATLLLAEITRLRQKFLESESALYVGRVAHTRFLPVKHGFSYPFFIACIDLEENFQDQLWPLSSCMSLRQSDHYKNDEGGNKLPQKEQGPSSASSLLERTFRLVKQKTNGKFSPSTKTHRVKLLTHLRYYGYCFNPVSFYYVQHRSTNKTDAIVAEVSNTPWNEMRCYVLHRDSVDMTEVKPGNPKGQIQGTNYVFQKTFHVSPFMDMDHNYDWTFWEFTSDRDPISISTSMVKNNDDDSGGKSLYFNAYVQVRHTGLHPHRVAWQIVTYPVYCLLIQIWIHYEALWLFVKGVAYVPHPDDSETTASRIIGNMMVPFFALKDWFDGAGAKKTK